MTNVRVRAMFEGFKRSGTVQNAYSTNTPVIGLYLVSDQKFVFGARVKAVLMGSVYRMSIVRPMNKAFNLTKYDKQSSTHSLLCVWFQNCLDKVTLSKSTSFFSANTESKSYS